MQPSFYFVMRSATTRRDPVELEIFKNIYHSIAEEMGAALRRTAFSPNIKERRDYSCAVFDSDAEVIAMGDHMPVHLGSMPMSVRGAIDHFLARKTSVHIQLAAQPKGSVVAVTADAEGSFAQNEPIHLRLALAEERVFMRGSNGIREHEMVVRAMPGGSQGVELKDGKLHYQGTIDLKAVKEQLNDQLSADEEKHKSKFSSKPLDLSHLRLVAFVQNDRSREVYQAKLVPFPMPAGSSASNVEPSTVRPNASTVARDGKKP